jgi:Zn-dependent protease with chaperone function
MRKVALVSLALACLSGCSTHPITGRDQIVAFPVVQRAHAEMGFALFTGAGPEAGDASCAPGCDGDGGRAQFARRVAAIGARLGAAARELSPADLGRMRRFRFEVNDALGSSTGSSAGGRIALGSGLALLEPTDTEIAFLVSREMAHVIARHAEENSGASLLFSVLGQLLLPGAHVIARLVATTIGSQALKGSWAAAQQREADDIAIALMARIGLPPFDLALALQDGAMHARLPAGAWSASYLASARYVDQLAATVPISDPAATQAAYVR